MVSDVRQADNEREDAGPVANTALSEISGNVRKPGVSAASTTASAKRSINDYFARLPKKQRRDDPNPAIPSPAEDLQASIDSLTAEDAAADEEDWMGGPESVQVIEDDLAPSAPEPEQPVVDENGWIRVGTQPVAAHDHDIRSAPSSYVDVMLKRKLQRNSQISDAKVPGADSANVEEGCQRLLQELKATLTEHTNGYVKRLCDYTGMDLIWTPGPKSMSLEAVYPFVSQSGSLRYHASPNAHLIMTALNIVKRRYPIVVLPILAVILNAVARPDIETQQPAIAWAFNALCNAASMHHSFRTVLSAKPTKFETWAAMDESKQKGMLEALRTVQKTPAVDDVLSGMKPEYLFRVDGNTVQTRKPSSTQREKNVQWDRKYPVLLRIAAEYGVNSDDFEFYLTIPSERPDKRVFYPFHVLSRPQAQTIGWDWHHLAKVAARMLHTMRTSCNRHAEAKGLGDKGMDETRFVYWMAALFSRQIQTIKKDMPTARREEIRFLILDRWGLPIVPWVLNVLCASLCKGPDHGIAMKFGVTEPAGLESFDPARHIDLDKCTITIDTIATNMAMWNYQRGSWPQIREILSAVPLRHALWRIDDSGGEKIWGAASDPTIAPVAPVPGFDVPLVSIDSWFSGSVLRPRCEKCNLGFQNLGLLVQHCRNTHSSGATLTQDAPASAEQDNKDAEYWLDHLVCSWPGCGKVFTRRLELDRHFRGHTGDRRYVCHWENCGYATTDAGHLASHKRTHTPDQRYACTFQDCTHVATSAPLLAGHIASHTGEKPWECPVEGCTNKYATHSGLIVHRKAVHTGTGFRCDLCDTVCTQKGNLTRHKNRKHPGWND